MAWAPYFTQKEVGLCTGGEAAAAMGPEPCGSEGKAGADGELSLLFVHTVIFFLFSYFLFSFPSIHR